MEPHSYILRHFFSDVQDVIAHPRRVASMLYQEGMVSEDVVDEVIVSTKPCSEKNASIMRAVSAAVKADPKKLFVLIAVLEKFPESAPVASKMGDTLCSHGLEGKTMHQDDC